MPFDKIAMITSITYKGEGKTKYYEVYNQGEGDEKPRMTTVLPDSPFLEDLKRGLKEKLAMNLSLEKNDRGYWDFVSVGCVSDEIETQPETHESEEAELGEVETVKTPTKPTIKEPAPQAVGMTVKLIEEMIYHKTLKPVFGETISKGLVTWLRSQVLGTTRIPFEGKDLPEIKFDKKEE